MKTIACFCGREIGKKNFFLSVKKIFLFAVSLKGKAILPLEVGLSKFVKLHQNLTF